MPVPTYRAPDHQLDRKLFLALDEPQFITVPGFAHDAVNSDGVTRNARPVRVAIEIRCEGSRLTWRAVEACELDGTPIPLPDPNRLAMPAWERRWSEATHRLERAMKPGARTARDRYGLDGDREIRVLAEFPPPRGYGEA